MVGDIKESIIAVDLGGTKILVGEITPNGDIIHSQAYPSHTTTQATALESVIQAIDDYTRSVGLTGQRQTAIGIGLVGRVDSTKGIWFEIEPGKSQMTDVKAMIENRYQLPCGVDNDVRCATKSEQIFGWGRISNNFIYINVGTGIAAGFVVEGEIIQGSHFNAGEVGHMVVDCNSDILCGCGRQGCVERIASGLGLHERITALYEQYPDTSLKIDPHKIRVDAQSIFREAACGDELCHRVTEQAAKALAVMTMNLIRVTDPDAIVFGGGVVQDQYFLDRVKSYLNYRTIRFVKHGIVTSQLSGAHTGLVGAALVGMEADRRTSSEQ